jgi:signal transduction histidine kinase
MYLKFGGFIFIYYFISIIDASMLLYRNTAYFMLAAIYASLVFLSLKPMYYDIQNTTLINIFINTIIVFIFGTLGTSIAEEQKRKKEAQELYDKLRVSEAELQNAYKRLEEYSATIEELTLLRERNRISRELHDSVGHTLSTLIIQLQALPHIIPKDPDKSIKMVNKLVDFSKKGMENVRRAVKDLKPTNFDDYQGIFAIKELIHNYEKLSPIKINYITFNYEINLNADESFIIYRIIQEALNNASKYSQASNIILSLQGNETNTRLYIKDDGKGTDSLTLGFGLNNMKDRVEKIGGSIQFNSSINNGFEIIADLPRI